MEGLPFRAVSDSGENRLGANLFGIKVGVLGSRCAGSPVGIVDRRTLSSVNENRSGDDWPMVGARADLPVRILPCGSCRADLALRIGTCGLGLADWAVRIGPA